MVWHPSSSDSRASLETQDDQHLVSWRCTKINLSQTSSTVIINPNIAIHVHVLLQSCIISLRYNWSSYFNENYDLKFNTPIIIYEMSLRILTSFYESKIYKCTFLRTWAKIYILNWQLILSFIVMLRMDEPKGQPYAMRSGVTKHHLQLYRTF